jgi:hypothetical protein
MRTNSKQRIYVSCLSLAMLPFVTACNKKLPDPEDDDDRISLHVRGKFGTDSGLQYKQISVHADKGVVTLSGLVDSEAERSAAVRYAYSERGVRQVVDHLSLPAQPSEANPAESSEKPIPAAKPRARKKPPSNFSTAASLSDVAAPDAPAVTQVAAGVPDLIPETALPPPPKVSIPPGTALAIRLIDAIDSGTAAPGQLFQATLESPLSYEGDIVVPSGYTVEGHVVDVKSAGKFAGKSELTLQLDRLLVGMKSYSLQTDQYHRVGASRGKDTATKVGAGAVIGALIGGLSAGGKGAAIGAAAGGGLGGGVQASTKGQQIALRSEAVLNFTLQSSLTVIPTTESASLIPPRTSSQNAENCSLRQEEGNGCPKEKCEVDCGKRPHRKGPVWP